MLMDAITETKYNACIIIQTVFDGSEIDSADIMTLRDNEASKGEFIIQGVRVTISL